MSSAFDATAALLLRFLATLSDVTASIASFIPGLDGLSQSATVLGEELRRASDGYVEQIDIAWGAAATSVQTSAETIIENGSQVVTATEGAGEAVESVADAAKKSAERIAAIQKTVSTEIEKLGPKLQELNDLANKGLNPESGRRAAKGYLDAIFREAESIGELESLRESILQTIGDVDTSGFGSNLLSEVSFDVLDDSFGEFLTTIEGQLAEKLKQDIEDARKELSDFSSVQNLLGEVGGAVGQATRLLETQVSELNGALSAGLINSDEFSQLSEIAATKFGESIIEASSAITQDRPVAALERGSVAEISSRLSNQRELREQIQLMKQDRQTQSLIASLLTSIRDNIGSGDKFEFDFQEVTL